MKATASRGMPAIDTSTMEGEGEGDGSSTTIERKDRSGSLLKIGDRVRDAKADDLRVGTVECLDVDGKPLHVSVKWDRGQKRKKPIVAKNLRLITAEEVKEIEHCKAQGRKVFNPARDWNKCSFTDAQVAELKRVGTGEQEWGPEQHVAAEAQLVGYGLSLGQLADKATKWVTVGSTASETLSDEEVTGYR